MQHACFALVALLGVAACSGAPPAETAARGGFGGVGNPSDTRTGAEIRTALAPTGAAPANRLAAMSDEQDFQAVSTRETIESDAERLARMQEQRVIVPPEAIPDRPAGARPNVIEYALRTSHPVGQQIYNRWLRSRDRHVRNCLAYRSADLAQEAFLSLGGPRRDRQALDPDGDGYACGWDPLVYRNAAQSARGG